MNVEEFYHNYSFWIKSLLCLIIVTIPPLMKMDLHMLPESSLKIIEMYSSWSLGFLFLCGAVPIARKLLTYEFLDKKNQEDLDENLITLAKEMGSDFRTYIPIKKNDGLVSENRYLMRALYFIPINENDALVYKNKYLMIGDELKSRLSNNELRAVLAHEFTHKIRNTHHSVVYALGAVVLLLLKYVPFLFKLPSMGVHFIVGCFYLIIPQFIWYRELDCDENAINYVDIDDLKNALLKIRKGREDVFSFMHPSVNYRVKNLERCRKPKNLLFLAIFAIIPFSKFIFYI